jgi:alpha-amylase
MGMLSVCFYFQIHQPWRLRRYSVFDTEPHYFDEGANRHICRRVAESCYLPTGRLLLDLIERHEGRYRVSFSITGVALEQFEEFSPEVIDLFARLSETGCVEYLSETYYHGLAWLYAKDEFKEQVRLHR